MPSPTINTLTSFSGADMIVNFANKTIGELQQISWAIQREKAPLYTTGSPDPRSITRGKRAIAGNMSFAVLDHDSIITAMQSVWDKVAPKAMFTAAGNVSIQNSEDFSKAMDIIKWSQTADQAAATDYTTGGTSFGFAGTNAITPSKQEGSDGAPILDNSGYYAKGWNKGDDVYVPPGFNTIKGSNIEYADQIPPFDITMTFGNEYGQAAFQKIYDVDILNEGSGVSVDTLVIERQMTYIARKISPLIRGIYSRESGGMLQGIQPTDQ